MCGIIGYTGKGAIWEKLIQGLQRLEYRGYDSSGIALNSESRQLHLLKRKGNLEQLKNAVPDFIENIKQKVHSGIAHTRWATHGKPTENNAHPHLSRNKNITVVHNGIIENYLSLKKELIRQGFEFVSDTDTEVLAHLIELHYDGDLMTAVSSALELVEGTYGLAIMCNDEPGTIIAARKSSPLLIGLASDGTYISSDVVGVVQDTQKVIHLKDYDIAKITEGKAPVIKNMKSMPADHKVVTVDFHVKSVSKGEFEDFMLKEIHEQPDTIRNAIRGRILMEEGTAKLTGLNHTAYEIAHIKNIIIVACGTSRLAGILGEYMIEEMAGVPVSVEYASEFRYRNPIITPNTVVFAISQSGETADTLAALKEAKLKGAKVFGIVNSVSSAIAREAGQGIYLHAGPEISVASTKAFTSQVAALSLLGLMLGRSRRLSLRDGQQIIRDLEALPKKIEHILQKEAGRIEEIAQYIKEFEHIFYLGRNYNFPAALEGALKLKEISYIHAEGYEAAELKHGPLALLDPKTPVLSIMTQQAGYDKMIGTVKEVMAREAPVICLATEGDEEVNELTEHIIRIPECPEYLSPILNVVALQLLAYKVAKAKNLNVDQPRNLAKSVTVE